MILIHIAHAIPLFWYVVTDFTSPGRDPRKDKSSEKYHNPDCGLHSTLSSKCDHEAVLRSAQVRYTHGKYYQLRCHWWRYLCYSPVEVVTVK